MQKVKRPYRFWRRLLRVLGVLVGLIVLFFLYLVWVSNIKPPKVTDKTALTLQRSQPEPGLYTIGNNWLRKSNTGLYEMYVAGDAFERGVINGKLSAELVQSQEDYFTEQIDKMVPSKNYQYFLKYVIGWFNRNLVNHVTPEYKQEIYGVSQSASEKYGYIGTKYQRILNYHSAHDIGHALQNLMLVGCTSFGTWGNASQDSSLIIGRNFDFYVGDNFAKNKIVLFTNPKAGYKFMSVTWGGFIGVVSGMNEKGLTVTINAAKSKIPTGSATPVSLVAREILQYAKNISEAIAIAKSRKMFVSESFLVGSAADNKAVIIEKTPKSLEIYDPNQNSILCTNHFQSNGLGASNLNKESLAESASPYRYKRLTQLLQNNGPNTVQKAIDVLRDTRGIDGADIGLGNEKAVNQLIAHHAVVFQPKQLRVWVSTAPWQLGQFVCYDLNKIFSLQGLQHNTEIIDSAYTIAADTLLQTPAFTNFQLFYNMKHRVMDGNTISPDSMVAANPQSYVAYMLAGDYLYKQKNYNQALPYYRQALTKEIATVAEKKHIEQRIEAITTEK
jgi:isopenicillin-N N-acyltransferase-like protein